MSQRRTASRASRARILAYEALTRIDQRHAFAQDVIAKVIDGSDLSDVDCAFATRLVLGVVSTKGSLDGILDRCLNSPKDVKEDVRRALRISTYEIIYLGKSPHAAVDQGVELVKSVAPKASGLANAVLRKVLKAKAEFPFGDPDSSVEALSMLDGFPPWLTELLVDHLGWEGAREFEAASNEPAPIFIYANPVKAGERSVGELLLGEGHATAVDQVEGILLTACFKVDDRRMLAGKQVLDAIGRGEALVSDASAQAVASVCALCGVAPKGQVEDLSEFLNDDSCETPEPISFLELCSGRGTKTVMIQGNIFEIRGKQAEDYVAVDNVPFKCKLLEERAQEYGIHVSDALCADISVETPELAGKLFDVVFLDAPCSGLGTLRRHPEIRWRVTSEVIADDAALDAQLINAAAAYVRPGGFLVYATCTITEAEDESVVSDFLGSDAGAQFHRVKLFGRNSFAPQLHRNGPDAHFMCILQRL